MIRLMLAHRQRHLMAIHNRHDLHALAAPSLSDLVPAALGRGKRRIYLAPAFVGLTLLPQRIGHFCEHVAHTWRSHHC